METEARGHTAALAQPHAENLEYPVPPELLGLLADVASDLRGEARRAVEAILDEYITEWLVKLRPLPYIPNLVVEVATRGRDVPEMIRALGPGLVAEAMGLALAAKEAPCYEVLPRMVAIEEAMLEASEVEPGEAIRSVLESDDCAAHAALIASLLAVRKAEG